MPTGKRQQALHHAFNLALEQDLQNRILDFDTTAAEQAAIISSKLRAMGQLVEIRDVQIASITAARRGTLATRNTKHFIDSGISLVNPWA